MEKQKLNISCNTVTLAVFIDCDVNGNLRRLSETATEEELKEIWSLLTEEYAELSGNTGHDYLFSLTKKIARIEDKISAVNIAASLPLDEALAFLKKYGYTGTRKMIEARVKSDIITLEGYRNDLDSFLKNQKQKPATMADYINWITVVSKYMGYRIDQSVVTVTEFIFMDKLMTKEAK